MSIQALDAATAYGRAAAGIRSPLSQSAPPLPVGETVPETGGFGEMVRTMVGTAATSLRAADAASARQIAGKGDLIDVVTAIGAAETALDTVVAVRDRVVNAYSDIMRMQI